MQAAAEPGSASRVMDHVIKTGEHLLGPFIALKIGGALLGALLAWPVARWIVRISR